MRTASAIDSVFIVTNQRLTKYSELFTGWPARPKPREMSPTSDTSGKVIAGFNDRLLRRALTQAPSLISDRALWGEVTPELSRGQTILLEQAIKLGSITFC